MNDDVPFSTRYFPKSLCGFVDLAAVCREVPQCSPPSVQCPRPRVLSSLVGVAVLISCLTVGPQSARCQDSSQGSVATLEKPDAEQEKESESKPVFLRVLKEGKRPVALQTAVAIYKKRGVIDGPEVALIGAVHIAEASYYSELNQLFRKYEALLYEMVMDPEMGIPDPEERGVSPVSTIQVGMKDALKLTFQLDEIDYSADNFVHADMTPAEFFTTMQKREEGLMQMVFRSIGASLAMQSSGQNTGDLELIAALASEDPSRGMRRAFATQMEVMDGQMAALTGEDGKSTLITERNQKAFDVLDEELKAGKKKLGIFYGAGHLEDMHQRLVEEYGMELVETQWLNAWDLK
ncbi:MAG: hypothetical protein NXI32_22590 [bacterium]|nr:hypothetical protein [bacterium]